jgi:hypothetical protein
MHDTIGGRKLKVLPLYFCDDVSLRFCANDPATPTAAANSNSLPPLSLPRFVAAVLAAFY